MKAKLVLAILVAALGLSTCAMADVPITLLDENSSVSIDPYSQSGIFNWTVEIFDHMAQSAFWYRIGGEGVASPLSSLTVDHIDASATEATIYYTGAEFDLQVLYSLDGSEAGAGTSDLAQNIMIQNKTAANVTLHLFQYINYDLNGTPASEIATHVDATDVTQADGDTYAQVNPITPDYWEMGDAATLLNKLNTQSFSNLSNSASTYTGDAAFILQWDRFMVGGRSATPITADLQVSGAPVPEPGSLLSLIGAFGLVPALLRRRR